MRDKKPDRISIIEKNKRRPSEAQRERELKFVRKEHQLFDIAHANDMTKIKLEEDRKFLIDQCSERIMIITILDKKLAGMKTRVSERQREVQARKERASADDDAAFSTSKILSSAPLSSPDKKILLMVRKNLYRITLRNTLLLSTGIAKYYPILWV
ncbi:hypothetical protein AVEN_252976-1 [Araneus ventricosus]|uniref:Uncharacterized protein n=1 Tax=Araneus ventricosus TaxID=182803 RepID=A0A4Y2V7G4_ARAVE|nr:hypothetical protein AVEN_252976-1 [Araneus ventricosus]